MEYNLQGNRSIFCRTNPFKEKNGRKIFENEKDEFNRDPILKKKGTSEQKNMREDQMKKFLLMEKKEVEARRSRSDIKKRSSVFGQLQGLQSL